MILKKAGTTFPERDDDSKKNHHPLGWKFGLGDVHAVGVKYPVPHPLALTKSDLCEFGGVFAARRLDLDRALADFSFMAVLAKHIFHETSDITRHG
ncbi:MAG TPA: hypothetical protein VEW72_04245 [Burkholderiales bacterium]|nr:hypothetical protein [Burkholderiales bacterium]